MRGRENEIERKRDSKVAKKCHDKLWQKLCLLLLLLLLFLLLAACCKIWKNVCLSVPLCVRLSAKVCERQVAAYAYQILVWHLLLRASKS